MKILLTITLLLSVSCTSVLVIDESTKVAQIEKLMNDCGYAAVEDSSLPLPKTDVKMWEFSQGYLKVYFSKPGGELQNIFYVLKGENIKTSGVFMKVKKINLTNEEIVLYENKERQLEIKSRLQSRIPKVHLEDRDLDFVLYFIAHHLNRKFGEPVPYVKLFSQEEYPEGRINFIKNDVSLAEVLSESCKQLNLSYGLGANTIIINKK